MGGGGQGGLGWGGGGVIPFVYSTFSVQWKWYSTVSKYNCVKSDKTTTTKLIIKKCKCSSHFKNPTEWLNLIIIIHSVIRKNYNEQNDQSKTIEVWTQSDNHCVKLDITFIMSTEIPVLNLSLQHSANDHLTTQQHPLWAPLFCGSRMACVDRTNLKCARHWHIHISVYSLLC